MRRALFVLVLALCCSTVARADEVPPRRAYNQARAAFSSGDLGAAEKGFLAARDGAGADAELRYRAAFNLGLTYAKKADAAKEKPQDAVNALGQAAAWFRDAVRARPDDDGARVNLEIALRRMRTLQDKLTQGENSLEARLGRVIQDQRTLRDRVRGLLGRVRQAGAAAQPLAFQGEFTDGAAFERTLLGDAGAVLDLAGSERDRIQGQPADKRSDEDRVRLIQLENLEHYLDLARGTLADVARLLRHLQGDKAHLRADQALTELKRALEQMQDPVTVLKGLAADQGGLLGQTQVLDAIRRGALRLEPGPGKDKGDTPAPPPWLTAATLGESERALQPRALELLARLKAGVEHAAQQPPAGAAAPGGPSTAPAGGPSSPPGQPQSSEDVRRQRVLDAAREAIPHLTSAASAMDRAATDLGSDQAAAAARAEAEALAALLRALERFSGIRDLIELAYGDQAQVVAVLTPPGAAPADAPKLPPELQSLSTKDRATLVGDATARNRDRLGRLRLLIADEVQALAEMEKSKDPKQGAPDPQKIAAERERYKRAEELRGKAEAALVRLSGTLAGGKPGAREPAAEALKDIEELRRLFFSIIEHLKELLRDQTETHDRSGAAQALRDEDEKRRRLAPLAETQAKHAALGRALGEALAAQADQASQAGAGAGAGAGQGAPGGPGGPGGDPAEVAKALGEAATEVKQAGDEMDGAAQKLAADVKEPVSPDLEPVLEHQKQAIAHLEKALHILEPPEQKDQKDQKDKNKKQEQQQVSQEQAARRLQAIREREAERQRSQQKREQTPPEPVEKDW